MLKIWNLKDKIAYLDEVVRLEHDEWATRPKDNYSDRIKDKKEKLKRNLQLDNFCKLILLDDNNLVGFISIFPHDCDELPELSPWYATIYVKKEYRGNGYSKILNEAILNEAKNRNIDYLYLKTDLVNYYEKFGATYVKKINEKESLYKFNIKGL